jgi:son of sevenless-like protein
MTLAPAPALRQTQRGSNYNARNQSNHIHDSDSATQISQSQSSTSLARANADNGLHTSIYSMNGVVGTAPPGALYVRALYDYEADDRTSLSFHEGDVIQVITQLESGWWDGVINGVRGWFPSNYCQIITSPDEIPESAQNGDMAGPDDELEDQVIYEEEYEEDEESDQEGLNGLPLEGTDAAARKSGGADFWIPQATHDGRLYYYNTMTGESSMELPLESPTSLNESGPRDRMNVNMPDKTRPPAEMMARGLMQEEDEDSEANSASELEGESIMMASKGSLVSLPKTFVSLSMFKLGFLCVHPNTFTRANTRASKNNLFTQFSPTSSLPEHAALSPTMVLGFHPHPPWIP